MMKIRVIEDAYTCSAECPYKQGYECKKYRDTLVPEIGTTRRSSFCMQDTRTPYRLEDTKKEWRGVKTVKSYSDVSVNSVAINGHEIVVGKDKVQKIAISADMERVRIEEVEKILYIRILPTDSLIWTIDK